MAFAVEQQAIVFEGVTKSFAKKPVVRDLDLRVPKGAIHGLLGPNGAGKTTSIRMLMSILQPDAGTIRVFGAEPGRATKDRIGYLPEERGLYPSMKVLDNLVFFGTIRGLSTPAAHERARSWLDRLSMSDTADRKLQELSKGNQQKIQFIATVCHEPDLLVLDEPFTGLDPVNQDLVRATIRDLAGRGTAVILSTHRMDEVERLCSEITLVNAGRTLVQGRLDEVKRCHGSDTVRLDVASGTESIEHHPQIAQASRTGNSWEIRLVEGVDPSDFLRSIAASVPVKRFEVQVPSLHSIFVQLVGRSDTEPATASPTEVAS